ncbi:hypothetical protein OEA41_002833 [Lepraria neglecta]|uniref:Uncharacterized protein n=1 Tax=Lepraria neglecta TaxID=209136 RepID=A0AAD9Z4L8_9LECA|nr:hypothetical protein OEA41_002833 [Lepraria neglecta]
MTSFLALFCAPEIFLRPLVPSKGNADFITRRWDEPSEDRFTNLRAAQSELQASSFHDKDRLEALAIYLDDKLAELFRQKRLIEALEVNDGAIERGKTQGSLSATLFVARSQRTEMLFAMGERAEGLTNGGEAIQAWQQLVDPEDPVKLESEFGHMYAKFIVGTGYASIGGLDKAEEYLLTALLSFERSNDMYTFIARHS